MKKEQKAFKTEWDLSPILSSESASAVNRSLKRIESLAKKFVLKWKNRSDYQLDSKKLADALADFEKLSTELGKGDDAGYYFWLKGSLDQNNAKVKAQKARVRDRLVKISNDLQFFTHSISRIDPERHQSILLEPSIKPYQHFLAKMFANAKYLLSEEVEKVLVVNSDTAYSRWEHLTASFLTKESVRILKENGRKAKVLYGETTPYSISDKREVRAYTFKALSRLYKKYSDVAEADINAILAHKKVDDELRKAARPYTMSFLADDLEEESVMAMIKAVSRNYEIVHDYYALKAKIMGYAKLEVYDLHGKHTGLHNGYTFNQAVGVVRDVLVKLDSRFSRIFDDYLSKGRIDAFPKKGKYAGAFSVEGGKHQPGYVLLNFSGELLDITTLAHEIGHAINHELIKERQLAINANESLTIAECASTFFEGLVADRLLSRLAGKKKLALLMYKMEETISAVFDQVALFNFELQLHTTFRKRGYVSKKDIRKLYLKHRKNVFGDSVANSRSAGWGWVGSTHLRTYFYNYQYAFGLLVAKYLQSRISADHGFVSDIIEFLAAGGSDSPSNLFNKLGADVADEGFWTIGLEDCKKTLKDIEGIVSYG